MWCVPSHPLTVSNGRGRLSRRCIVEERVFRAALTNEDTVSDTLVLDVLTRYQSGTTSDDGEHDERDDLQLRLD